MTSASPPYHQKNYLHVCLISYSDSSWNDLILNEKYKLKIKVKLRNNVFSNIITSKKWKKLQKKREKDKLVKEIRKRSKKKKVRVRTKKIFKEKPFSKEENLQSKANDKPILLKNSTDSEKFSYLETASHRKNSRSKNRRFLFMHCH